MVTLLMIADDITGALDAGVQFASAGASTWVVTGRQEDFTAVEPGVQVLVVDAETRHLSPEEAYETVFRVARAARDAGVPYLYKKTDSALRGNIGSELQAVMDAWGRDRLHFLPALPAMGRTTVNGIHYIEGVPVAESVFGADPFEPVRHSDIGEILGGQTPAPIRRHGDTLPPEGADTPGIHIYDAQSEETLEGLAGWFKEAGELTLTAGCAGFAAVLPKVLRLNGHQPQPCRLPPPLLVVCGSVNPVTRLQLDEAERAGFPRVRLTPRQKLDPAWLHTEAGRRMVDGWAGLALGREGFLLDGNDLRPGETLERAERMGLDREQARVRVSAVLGALLKELLERGLEGTMLLTGGDTLLAFLRQIGVGNLIPCREVAPGAVLSRLSYRGKDYQVISKSGGFGNRELLCELAAGLNEKSEGERGEKIC